MGRRLSTALAVSLWFMLPVSFANASSLDFLNLNYLKNAQRLENLYPGRSSRPAFPHFGATFFSNFYGLHSEFSSRGGEFLQDVKITPAIFINSTSGLPVTGFMRMAGAGCSNVSFFCSWSGAGVRFFDTTKSDTFSGPPNTIGLTNITLGSNATAIPEPSSIYLLAIGIAACCARGLRFLKH
jgi:hypothetical protein